MTPEDLKQAVQDIDPEMESVMGRLKSLHVDARAAAASKDMQLLTSVSAELEDVKADVGRVSGTLDTLIEIHRALSSKPVIDPSIVYAEAVESRLAAARIKPEGVHAEEWRKEMYALTDAQSFYWSQTMASIVDTSAVALPNNTIVEPDLFPVLAGWWWFGRDNVVMADIIRGVPRRIAALAWLRKDETLWFAAYTADWPEVKEENGRLHTVVQADIRLNETLSSVVAAIPDDDACAARLVRFLVAGLLFVRQKVLVASVGTIGRGARRRVQQLTTDASVHIIHLRRGEMLRGHIVERVSETDFSCQWWVRGHWRQQPYRDGVRPKWIDPYIKGNPDAPMKTPGEKVFAVVR